MPLPDSARHRLHRPSTPPMSTCAPDLMHAFPPSSTRAQNAMSARRSRRGCLKRASARVRKGAGSLRGATDSGQVEASQAAPPDLPPFASGARRRRRPAPSSLALRTRPSLRRSCREHAREKKRILSACILRPLPLSSGGSPSSPRRFSTTTKQAERSTWRRRRRRPPRRPRRAWTEGREGGKGGGRSAMRSPGRWTPSRPRASSRDGRTTTACAQHARARGRAGEQGRTYTVSWWPSLEQR